MQVAVIMGSDSDMPVMRKALETLEDFGVDFEVQILSAHRCPDELKAYVSSLKDKGCQVIIAGAGMSAALPGACASHTHLPIVGVPLLGQALGGQDSLYTEVQMPPGMPVATMAINGAVNAALFAVQILALSNANKAKAYADYRTNQTNKCLNKNATLQEVGWKDFAK
ncbi:MAG: 5-(carboxyamino)imidazole ribonucleotide mutase [Candidatus Saccharibacteria bacterium]|nr:5-(carboxyamino)imidazole ribonucleotide mutase [Candidatus Saccharibacteria bacterium]